MFEIELKKNGEVSIATRKVEINVNVAQSSIKAGLNVGAIRGPGEFEIGDASIIGVRSGKDMDNKRGGDENESESEENNNSEVPERSIVYGIEIGGIRIGVTGNVDAELEDELGPIDILVTSSVKMAKAVEPKIVIPTENFGDFESELKVEARHERKLKIKDRGSLPVAMEVCQLG